MNNGSISWNNISFLSHNRVFGKSLEGVTLYEFTQMLGFKKPVSDTKLDGIIRRQRAKGIIE